MTAVANLLVLDDTVTVLGAPDIAPPVRSALGIEPDEFAVEGPGERSLARVVSGATAALLQRFETPTTVDAAILELSIELGTDPFETLDASLPVLTELIAAGILRPGTTSASAKASRRRVGDLIAGYRLERVIRDLPDSQVFQAVDELGRPVALKLVPSEVAAGSFADLRHEAAMQRFVAGPGVPAILDQGVDAGDDYLASEWCAGVPISIRAGELRSAGDAAALVGLSRRAVLAFARLHALGVVHGDVRASNVLVDRNDEVSLIDFGLAFRPGDRQMRRAIEFGTLEPEAAEAILSGRTAPTPTFAGEQYAIGALVWALLTGHELNPHVPTVSEMCEMIARRAKPSFASHGLPAWPDLESVLDRATAADPRRRFPTLDEFATALGGIASPLRRSGRTRCGRTSNLVDRAIELLASRDADGRMAADVHGGSAGAAWFLYRAAVIRGEPDLLAAAESHLIGLDGPAVGSLFNGRLGPHVIASLVAAARGDRSTALHHAEALPDARGDVSSIPPELFDGRAGDLCGLAAVRQALELERIPQSLSAAIASTRNELWRLLGRSGLTKLHPDVPHLGMAHGWAGILFSLMGSGAPDDNESLGPAVEQLVALGVPIGRGIAWPGTFVDGHMPRTPDFAPGWCAGSAGMIHVLADAKDRRIVDAGEIVEAAAWHCADHPDRTAQLCCGLAGRAIALCRAWRSTGNQYWLDRADTLLAEAEGASPGGPDGGLFRGSLGVALAALEFERPDTAIMPLHGPQLCGAPNHPGPGSPPSHVRDQLSKPL